MMNAEELICKGCDIFRGGSAVKCLCPEGQSQLFHLNVRLFLYFLGAFELQGPF